MTLIGRVEGEGRFLSRYLGGGAGGSCDHCGRGLLVISRCE